MQPLPTAGERVLAATRGTGTKSLGPVDASAGLQVLVSCVGTAVTIEIVGVSSGTHECGDGSPGAVESGRRQRDVTVLVAGERGTRWSVAVIAAR
ncbi:MAG TPA: hypothetical protein VNA20_07110 [Frankiaceae bacterium]|nr:hypothetical protein [Frankiaceae bacterium]